MQLRETKAIGFLNDHDRRVRDVDADLDHRRRDKHVEVTGLEACHELTALGGTQAPVQQADPVTAQLGLLQALGLRFRGPGLRRLRLLDQRADDVRLTSRVEVLPQARVGSAAPVLRNPCRLDRLTIGGWLCDLRHREVAVDGERKRARDRRRSHVQHMRRPACGQRLALLDAEAMLLVDDRDREVTELDSLLDERMCADDDVRIRSEVALTPGRGAREQCTADAEQTARLLECEEVLLRQRLRRRHQDALLACLDRSQQRIERHDGLAGSDLALKETLHRHALLEIAVEVDERALLILGQLERKDLPVARDQLAGWAERRCDLRFTLAPLARESDLQQVPALVEREPVPSSSAPRVSERGRCSAQSASTRSGSCSCSFSSAGTGSARARGSAAPTSSRSFLAVISSLAG